MRIFSLKFYLSLLVVPFALLSLDNIYVLADSNSKLSDTSQPSLQTNRIVTPIYVHGITLRENVPCNDPKQLQRYIDQQKIEREKDYKALHAELKGKTLFGYTIAEQYESFNWNDYPLTYQRDKDFCRFQQALNDKLAEHRAKKWNPLDRFLISKEKLGVVSFQNFAYDMFWLMTNRNNVTALFTKQDFEAESPNRGNERAVTLENRIAYGKSLGSIIKKLDSEHKQYIIMAHSAGSYAVLKMLLSKPVSLPDATHPDPYTNLAGLVLFGSPVANAMAEELESGTWDVTNLPKTPPGDGLPMRQEGIPMAADSNLVRNFLNGGPSGRFWMTVAVPGDFVGMPIYRGNCKFPTRLLQTNDGQARSNAHFISTLWQAKHGQPLSEIIGLHSAYWKQPKSFAKHLQTVAENYESYQDCF